MGILVSISAYQIVVLCLVLTFILFACISCLMNNALTVFAWHNFIVTFLLSHPLDWGYLRPCLRDDGPELESNNGFRSMRG